MALGLSIKTLNLQQVQSETFQVITKYFSKNPQENEVQAIYLHHT